MKSAATLRLVDAPVQPGAASPVIADARSTTAARALPKASSLEWLAQSAAALVLVVLSVGLLAWSGYLRHARRHAPQVTAAAATPRAEEIDPATFTALQQAADRARLRLLPDRNGFTALMARLEGEARQLGWSVSLDVSAPVDAPAGLEELTLHRAVMDLTPDETERARFATLIEWLDGISRLPVHAEIAALNLQGTDTGVTMVHMELHVLARNTHEASAPE